MEMDPADEDTIYPVDRARKTWNVTCPVVRGGCDAASLGDGPQGAADAWNRRAESNLGSKLRGEAITGAIAYGRLGVNPPEHGHWLNEYWHIGRQLAKLGDTSIWDNQSEVTPSEHAPRSLSHAVGAMDRAKKHPDYSSVPDSLRADLEVVFEVLSRFQTIRSVLAQGQALGESESNQ
jgi:hypothetical protein